MTDTPSLSFVPASQTDPQPPTPAAAPAPAPTPAAAPQVHHEPTNHLPTNGTAPAAQTVPIPRPSQLPVDPETGATYRPFDIGGVTVRCASEIPADTMLEVVAAQAALPNKRPEDMTQGEQVQAMQLLGQMLAGVVWDQDADKLRARLRDKVRPISLAELSQAIQRLWGSYNDSSGVGKEQ